MKVVEEREAGNGIIGITEDNILVFTPYPYMEGPTLEGLKKDHDVYLELTNGTPMPLLSDNRSIKKIGSAEQSYIKSTLTDFASKLACIVDSPLTRFLHNTFIHLYRPEVPVKMFTKEEDALKWIREGM